MSFAGKYIVISGNRYALPPFKFSTPITQCCNQLILFFSKSLLRHPRARSELSEMVGDTHFQRYLPEPHPESLVPAEQIRRHILCTGKFYAACKTRTLTRPAGQVYHTLLQEREEKGIKDVAISRVEQLSPFPYDLVRTLF